MRDSEIQTTGHALKKRVQILTYAGDLSITAGIKEKMIQAIAAFQMAAEKMDMKINRDKSRYMSVRMGRL